MCVDYSQLQKSAVDDWLKNVKKGAIIGSDDISFIRFIEDKSQIHENIFLWKNDRKLQNEDMT